MTKLTDNPIVAAILKADPTVSAVKILVGFPGPASRLDHYRIYNSLTLDGHIEFPKAAVLAAQHLGTHPWEPTAVWVRPETPVHVQSQESTVAAYASGPIASQYFPGAAPSDVSGVQGHLTHACGTNLQVPPVIPYNPYPLSGGRICAWGHLSNPCCSQ